ncbi:MAG TPA: hypothetical protein VMA31_04135 [Bryobacteraceae bacterium]|nr:hypothetical protein [Bryobacteraceae bacterium]
MRIDSGAVSIITDPKALHTIVLDHVAKEARLLPVQPPGAAAPKLPGMPASLLATPAAGGGAMAVVNLGKALIEGHEVEGKRYTLPVPAVPQPPKIPHVPGMPQASQKPLPAALPTTAEVWTSTKLGLPVLTKVTGPFGQLTCACKTAPATEPHPTLFQIPPEYKTVLPPNPALPKP